MLFSDFFKLNEKNKILIFQKINQLFKLNLRKGKKKVVKVKLQEASCLPPADELQAAADLDDTAVFVNVSEESRRKIEQITNVIGDCICALCKVFIS